MHQKHRAIYVNSKKKSFVILLEQFKGLFWLQFCSFLVHHIHKSVTCKLLFYIISNNLIKEFAMNLNLICRKILKILFYPVQIVEDVKIFLIVVIRLGFHHFQVGQKDRIYKARNVKGKKP